jgi:hypothetical protein
VLGSPLENVTHIPIVGIEIEGTTPSCTFRKEPTSAPGRIG